MCKDETCTISAKEPIIVGASSLESNESIFGLLREGKSMMFGHQCGKSDIQNDVHNECMCMCDIKRKRTEKCKYNDEKQTNGN